jgi:ABC-type multidrug transport system permease subunit
MRWVLLKDLQLLRRSPLVSALLIIYPVAIAVLIGFALSRGPEKPRVAFLDQVPEDEQLVLAGEQFDLAGARGTLCERIECIQVDDEQEAREMVQAGDALGALILPPDLLDRLGSLTSLTPSQPRVRVLVNEEDPVKARLVDDRISSLVTEANLEISKAVSRVGANYLDLVVNGGSLSLLGQTFDILGLAASQRVIEQAKQELPRSSPLQAPLQEVIDFGDLARDNLDLARPLLDTISHPIAVEKEVVSGSPPSLDAFAIAVAATLTLTFVTVLLVAGSLALEREENAFSRLVRGLISRTALLVEKISLGVVASVVVTLLMLAGLTLFVDIQWERFPLILAAILAGGAGFAAFGAAIGGITREVRASSLLAFMVALPVAFLSLIPSGTVSPGLFDLIELVRALFPFQPSLRAMEGALEAAGPSLVAPLAHLGILVLAYGALARLSLRRFA